jgi:eukaryotic-like serine/threonine-protein kinase
VVLKALSKNPLNRYQSAAEMRSDLIRVRNGQSPMAPMVMSEDERTALLAASGGTPTRRLGGGRHNLPPPAGYDDDYYDEEPRRGRGKTIGIVLAVAAALGLVGFVAFQVFGGSPAPTMVEVPTVTGLPEQDARNQILSAGLRVGQVTSAPSDVGQIGRITSTNPPVGQQIEERSTVDLVVGAGPESVNVPLLEGMTLQEATTRLEQAGLRLGPQTTQETSDRNLIDRIIESNPRAGETVRGQTEIAVVVGAEQTGIQIPDVRGQDPDDAEDILRDLGLSVQRDENDSGSDRVSGTNPSAGTKVQRGSEVTLQTGQPDEIEMPDVRGMQIKDAEQRLRSLGFSRVQGRSERTTDEQLDDRVIEQSVQPGDTVSPDDRVQLTYGEVAGSTTR